MPDEVSNLPKQLGCRSFFSAGLGLSVRLWQKKKMVMTPIDIVVLIRQLYGEYHCCFHFRGSLHPPAL